ncbi:MAG: UvrD-helicase domain-containing protein [Ruminococcus sp.]|nr:UvrD-helicase domain-containing protein [Ruminococcus sp.]
MPAEWTKQQLDAIQAKGRAVTVSAAAGSGKTAVLVEKLLRLLSDKEEQVSADSIVLATFTKDAADQMKQRLSAALSEALENDPENERLAVQLSLIPSAKISTIHSFCFDLIRENCAKLDADSSFRVLDPAEDDLIREAAAENVFEEWFGSRREDMKRLTDFFCPGARDRTALAQLVAELEDKILALPFPEDYMDSAVMRYRDPPEPENDELIALYTADCAERIARAAVLAEECLSEITEICGDEGLKIDKIRKNIELLRAERDNVTDIADRAAQDPSLIFSGSLIPEFGKIIFYKSGSYKDGGTKTDCEFDGELINAAADKRKQYRDILSKCCGEFTYGDIKGDYIIHAEICEKLFALIKDIMAEEKRIKDEKNALGFSDAEQLACRLLCSRLPDGSIEKTALAQSLSESFSIVMIDEFQDSTAVQELIFRMISRDGGADRPGTNFFAVGDVKQSIYRFRSADPEIFLANINAGEDYSENGSREPARIVLNKNFRSSRHVVDFVNAVFDPIMSARCGGVDYGEAERLVKGSDIPDDLGETEIIDLPPVPEDGDVSEIQAQCVAERIKRLLETGVIRDGNGERKVLPSDICILTRTSANGALIDCLERNGIPAEGAAESGFLSSREISAVINLLRCIDNPTLDIPLASVLMSPMFMFTAEDMARLRLKKSQSVFSDILEICADESSPKRLYGQCARFRDIFGELREYAASHGTEELIEHIYDKTDLMALMNIYPDGASRRANLRLLKVYAAEHDAGGSGGLAGWIARINGMAASGKDLNAAGGASGADAVSVKTIHRSKGLEYPFVFLCSTWTEFNVSDAGKRTVFASKYGAAFRIGDPDRLTAYESFPRKAVSIAVRKAQRDEEMMLLYVALTRAKYKLFITRRTDEKALSRREKILAMVSARREKQDTAVNAGRSMADWLDVALSLFRESGEGVLVKGGARAVVVKGVPLLDGDGSERTESGSGQAADYDETAAELFRENISRSYDLTLADTAAKLTVSEISGAHDLVPVYLFTEDSENYRRRRLPEGISAADAGTAVHSFMQYADITPLYKDRTDISEKIRGECRRLCGKGLITPAQAECVGEDMIVRFLESGLCRRMMSSPEIYREKKFLVKISEINLDDSELMVYNNSEGMLQGVADCVFREGDGFVLVDYKTDRNVTAEILSQRYGRQLYLYKKALSLILDSPVKKCCLYSFALGREITLDL